MHDDRPFRKSDIASWAEVEQNERAALGLSGPDDEADALCLSGGGVRSAAFCLGVLQALDAGKLLTQFHYLSTVSGGGFIGGWLTRWMAGREGHEDGAADLPRSDLPRPGLPGPGLPGLASLRAYTSYLTPEPGLVSADTWQGIMLWCRNTLINWALFAPMMLAAACLPLLYLTAACLLAGAHSNGVPLWFVLTALALAALTWSVRTACIELPSHSHPDADPRTRRPEDYGPDGGQVYRRIIVPSLLWVLLGPLAAAPFVQPGQARDPAATLFASAPDRQRAGHPCQPAGVPCDAGPAAPAPRAEPVSAWLLAFLPVAGFLACILAYVLAWRRVVSGVSYGNPENRSRHQAAFATNLLAWSFSSAAGAALLFAGMILAVRIAALWLVILGPVWMMLADILRTTAYVALRTEGIRSELDREWLARLNGGKLRFVLAFALAELATLFLPHLVFDRFGAVWSTLAIISGFMTGPVVAKIGSSALTAFAPARGPAGPASWLRPDWIIAGLALLFMVAIFMLSGRAAAGSAILLARLLAERPGFDVFAVAVLLVLAAFVRILAFLSQRVKINRFSMHAVYRNRIVRAFLGSARPAGERRPDRYTGFDPEDNLRVADLFTGRQPPRLFPVINVTVNRTTGMDPARAERKADSFTITPLHCGSSALDAPRGAYVPTRFYAGDERETGPGDKKFGISMGTAMAISGAAISPNMGYHSSPLTAFVMTLFNLRLGAWLPNPAMKDPSGALLQRSSPGNALVSALGDLFGQSGDRGRSLYLSDGGHFDNLGLYEMLRRHCRRIVIVDAGCDGRFQYEDLARVLQRAAIDLRVSVQFLSPVKVGSPRLAPCGAYARISYGDDGANRIGELLAIKPWLPDDAALELQSFKARNASFPHVSTTDQFFGESMFESYRALGQFLAGRAIGPADSQDGDAESAGGLETMFRRARALAGVGESRMRSGGIT